MTTRSILAVWAPGAWLLATCSWPAPTAVAFVAVVDGDADTDVDTDADPMCSSAAPSLAWSPAPAGQRDVRVRLRADWDCASLHPAYAERCVVLQQDGWPVWGADPRWYLSGLSDPLELEIVGHLPADAFVATSP